MDFTSDSAKSHETSDTLVGKTAVVKPSLPILHLQDGSSCSLPKAYFESNPTQKPSPRTASKIVVISSPKGSPRQVPEGKQSSEIGSTSP